MGSKLCLRCGKNKEGQYPETKCMCAEELPKVRIGDRRYYQDDRLEEFRAVDNPHDRISFGDLRRLYSKISGQFE